MRKCEEQFPGTHILVNVEFVPRGQQQRCMLRILQVRGQAQASRKSPFAAYYTHPHDRDGVGNVGAVIQAIAQGKADSSSHSAKVEALLKVPCLWDVIESSKWESGKDT